MVNVGADEAATAADGMPYTTVGYMNGFGFNDLGTETDSDAIYSEEINAGRMDITSVDTTAAGYHQEALIPLSSETHSGEDIALHGTGPGSQLIQGVIEQSVVFHLINQSLGLIEE